MRSLVSPELPLPREHFLLRWEVGPGWEGARFTVRITLKDLEPVAEAPGLEESQYLVPEAALKDLPAGTLLLWQVEAMRPGEEPVKSRTFRARLDTTSRDATGSPADPE